jgi:hypothetical protein
MKSFKQNGRNGAKHFIVTLLSRGEPTTKKKIKKKVQLLRTGPTLLWFTP